MSKPKNQDAWLALAAARCRPNTIFVVNVRAAVAYPGKRLNRKPLLSAWR